MLKGETSLNFPKDSPRGFNIFLLLFRSRLSKTKYFPGFSDNPAGNGNSIESFFKVFDRV